MPRGFSRIQGTKLVLAGFLACSCLVSSTSAREFQLDAAVSGGVSIPISPTELTDFWGTGFTLGFEVSYRVTQRLRLGIATGYSRHNFDSTAYEASISERFPDVQVDGNALNTVPLMLVTELALLSRGSTRPYVSLGIGYSRLSVATPAVSGPNSGSVQVPDPSDDVAGMRMGLGVWTALTPASTLFLEATYHIAWTKDEVTSFLPLRAGVRF